MIKRGFAATALAVAAGCAHSPASPGLIVGSTNDQPMLDQYLAVFIDKSADDLPLTDGATFYGALLPAPIVGRDEVTAFLNRVSPAVDLVEVRQRFEGESGACAELLFRFGGGVELEEAHCLTIQGDNISAIRLYYDPRPLLDE